MIQNFIVAIIVSIAALYAIKRYAPKRLVRKGGAWVAMGMAAIGLIGLSKRMARHWTVESPTGKSCGSGCGSCGGCGTPIAASSAILAAKAELPIHQGIKRHVIVLHQKR